MPLKAILFDIGRVIVRLDVRRAFLPFLPALCASNGSGAPKSPEQIWAALQSDPRWWDWQEGRMTPPEWHEYMTRHVGIRASFGEFRAAWNSVLDPETILPESLFAQLAARFHLGLLSNTDPLHSAYLEEHFSFVRHFPVRVYSNEVGSSKPSPAIYRAALAALGASPADTLYIDDIAEFAEAARRLGLDAIHFENPEQLAREFSQRGIDP